MRKLTKLDIIDISLFILGVVVISILPFRVVDLSETILPTAINGIATVTGIIVAATSGLIAFTMSLHVQHNFPFKKYRTHSILSLIIVALSLSFLMVAYTDVLANRLVYAAKEAQIALIMSILNLCEFIMSFDGRILEDLIRGQ
jgi:hypothetical protein